MTMRILCAVLLLILPTSAFSQSESPPQHPLLTAERLAEVEKGKVVVVKAKEREGEKKSAAASAAALALIDKPASEVFDVLLAFEQQADYMPRLVEVNRYELDGPAIGLHHKLKVVWKTVEYYLHMSVDEDNLHMSWTLDPTKENGIETTDGAWTLLPWGEDRCIAVYEIDVDTGMAVPKFVAQMLLNSDLPGVLDALKQRAESGGTWTK